MELNKIISFVDFISAFSNIQRGTKIKGKETVENDAEHSYQVALVSWYVADSLKLSVNKQRLFEYALAHDLVETYAGDTDVFNKGHEEAKLSKHEREELAKQKIQEQFSDFTSLHESMSNYESLMDLESKLVYVVDKLLPDINIYLSGDTYYKDNNVSYEDWEKWLKSKVEHSKCESKELLALVDQLIAFSKEKTVFCK